MRTAAFYVSCAALGWVLAGLIVALITPSLVGEPGGAWALSARDASDFVADVESWVRGEGY